MTIQEQTAAQLEKIRRDKSDPEGVNAVLELNPDALAIAGALEHKPPEAWGMLAGMTILLKDNINTADRTHTSAGALALAGHIAAEDAYLVRRLREEDAVLLGKANMTELANYMAYDMPPGYSSRGGQVINPHNPEESPGGSSSGCAAAVAAGLCTAAVGTETSGSIISPSQNCGVVGIKPTPGLVSRTGIIPISITMDTAGPIAGSVRDAAKVLRAIAGYDPADPATAALRRRPVPDYIAALDAARLEGARIGVNTGIEPSADYREHSVAFLNLLRDRGAELVAIEPVPYQKQAQEILKYEFKAAMDSYLRTAGRNAAPRTLADIAAFNRAHPDTALRYGQQRLEAALNEASGLMNEPAYLDAMAARSQLREQVLGIYEKHRLDAIVEAAGWNSVASYCGFPAGTVPIGWYDCHVPVGCYLMCRPFDEETLLSLLYAVEQAAGFQKTSGKRPMTVPTSCLE